jgi:hypothetical protein
MPCSEATTVEYIIVRVARNERGKERKLTIGQSVDKTPIFDGASGTVPDCFVAIIGLLSLAPKESSTCDFDACSAMSLRASESLAFHNGHLNAKVNSGSNCPRTPAATNPALVLPSFQ